MKRFLMMLLAASLTACSGGQDEAASTKAKAAEPEKSATSSSPKKNNPLPPGFSLPFSHYIRANRSEALGGATKKRVIVEVRGIGIEQADEQVAAMAAAQGYARGQLEKKKEGGFNVGYQHPELGSVKTSYFEGTRTQFSSKDATGIMQITWIARP